MAPGRESGCSLRPVRGEPTSCPSLPIQSPGGATGRRPRDQALGPPQRGPDAPARITTGKGAGPPGSTVRLQVTRSRTTDATSNTRGPSAEGSWGPGAEADAHLATNTGRAASWAWREPVRPRTGGSSREPRPQGAEWRTLWGLPPGPRLRGWTESGRRGRRGAVPGRTGRGP